MNQARKRAHSLFNFISVTDGLIIIGPLYLQTEFEAISLLLQKSYGIEHCNTGTENVKVFYPREMVWYIVFEIDIP